MNMASSLDPHCRPRGHIWAVGLATIRFPCKQKEVLSPGRSYQTFEELGDRENDLVVEPDRAAAEVATAEHPACEEPADPSDKIAVFRAFDLKAHARHLADELATAVPAKVADGLVDRAVDL